MTKPKVPPQPGDEPKFFGAIEVICDEVITKIPKKDGTSKEVVTSCYRAFCGTELLVQSRSWAVVCLIAFGDIPRGPGAKADVAAHSAATLAKAKEWKDPETDVVRTVVSAAIVNCWNVILTLDDGERIHLGEEGRVKRRFFMASSDLDAADFAANRVARAGCFDHRAEHKPTTKPRKKEPRHEPPEQGTCFSEPPLPAPEPRKNAFDGDQGCLF